MKTKNLKFIITYFVLCSVFLIPNYLYAQIKWESKEISTKSSKYNIEKKKNSIYIVNTKFKGNRNGRKRYNSDKNEFSSVKLHSHDGFLKIFTEVFESERIKELANYNERIIFYMSIDEKGQVFSVRFSLNKETWITIEEIEQLENQVLTNLQFEIVGKKVSEPIYYAWSIQVFFKEVEKGEIEFARKSENYTG
jgi:curved DNA-binding protein CbpA